MTLCAQLCCGNDYDVLQSSTHTSVLPAALWMSQMKEFGVPLVFLFSDTEQLLRCRSWFVRIEELSPAM